MVTGTAAQIAIEPLTHFSFCGLRAMLYQVERTHDHTRCTKPALQTVVLLKCTLHGVQFVTANAFDSGNSGTFMLYRQCAAAFYRLSVNVHHTGTALRSIAADMRAGQATVFAQQFNQQSTRLYFG
jgi:hypothetical protein